MDKLYNINNSYFTTKHEALAMKKIKDNSSFYNVLAERVGCTWNGSKQMNKFLFDSANKFIYQII